jgi:hypothetical protein
MADNNNPIKASDLVKDDGAIRAIIDELKEMLATYTELIRKVQAEGKKFEEVTRKGSGAASRQTEKIDEQARAAANLVKSYERYNVALSETGKELAQAKIALQEQNRLNKLEAKLADAKAGSYNELSAQYSINKIRLNALSEEERKNTQEGIKLEAQSRKLFERMNQLQKATGKYTLQVGNYTVAIKDAGTEQRKLVKRLDETKEAFETAQGSIGVSQDVLKAYETEIATLTEQIDNLGAVTGKTAADFGPQGGFASALLESEGAAGQAARGVKGLGQSLKALLANPVVLFLSLIAAGLATLFSAFQRSEKGQQLLTRATGAFNAILSQLTDLSTEVAEAVEFVFSNPQEAVKQLGSLIKENIINRFEALPLLAAAAGDAITALWNRDLDALKTAGQDAFTAVNQAITGLDEGQQQALVDGIKETTEELIKETNAFIDLEVAKRNVNRANRALVRSIEELTTQEQLSQAVADNTTKSFKEREEAAEAARQATEARAAAEIELARNNLGLINREIDLRRANGEAVEALLDQQLGLYRELAAAERDLTVTTADNERTRAELKQDRLERDLDILIDGFDNQKTINERLLADDRKTLEERQGLLAETAELADASFAKQIETIQQFTGVQVDANSLIAESDAVALNQKIRGLGLSEIIEGRLLEIVRERRLVNQDLAEAEADLAAKSAERDAKALEAQEARLKKERDERLKSFDEQQALARSQFDLTQATEAEKTRFRLQAEADRLREVIAINEELEGELSDTVIQTYRNRVQGIEAELAKVDDGEGGLLSKLGINLTDEQQAQLKASTDFIKQQLIDVFNTQKELADQAVEDADRRVGSAEAALQAEISLAANGSAARIETRRQELAREQQLQEEAVERQRKAAKVQRDIQTGQQAVNLITATTKIFRELPIFAAIPAVGLMFGTFVASKIKAAKLARQNFRDGGYEEITTGGLHGSGNDTFVGIGSKGQAMYAERGESLAVFNRKTVRREGSRLASVVRLLNRGAFDDVFAERELANKQSINAMLLTTPQAATADTSTMEESLEGIRKNTASRETTNAKGQRVVRSGWETKTYVG